MRRLAGRITGVVLIAAAVLGVVLSISGLVFLWRIEPVAADTIVESVDLLDRTLTVTADLLVTTTTTLESMETNITLVSTSLEDVSITMKSTSETADHVSVVIGEDLSDIITDTQEALGTMQTSAKLIDDTLRVISAIPFVGAQYRPEVPMQDAISNVSESLSSIPDELKIMQTSLEETSTNFEILESDVSQMAVQVAEIETQITSAKRAADEYSEIISESQSKIKVVRTRIHNWVRTFVWGGTGLMIWLLIAQIGLFTQGLDLLRQRMVLHERLVVTE